MKDHFCHGIIIWTFTYQGEFKLENQPILSTISMNQIDACYCDKLAVPESGWNPTSQMKVSLIV